MIGTHLGASKWAHNHVIIVPKLTWGINAFLNVHILTWEFFNFPFDCILHEMFLLTLILRVILTIVCSSFCLTLRIYHLILVIHHTWVILFLESVIVGSDTPRNGRWWLHSNATSSRVVLLVCIILIYLVFVLHIVLTIIVLYSLSTPTVCQIVMHYLPAFPLSLYAASRWTVITCSIAIV
jgi:hypothetical protein